MKKLMFGFLVVGQLVGVARFAVFAAVANDLLVYSSSLGGGTANGFVGLGTYKNGARVYLNVLASYGLHCINDDPDLNYTSTGSDSHLVAGAHYAKFNRKGKLVGYTWNASFSFTPPSL